MASHKLLRAAFGTILMGSVLFASAQCTNNNTISGSAIVVPCPGSISGGCINGGRFALVTVVAGNTYTFSTCAASWNTLITLYSNTGGILYGFNDDDCNGNRSAVAWTATYSGSLRVLVDKNNCGNNSTCAPLWITCSLNDEPCTATNLPVNTSCSNAIGTNVGATSSGVLADPSCSNYGGGDVWFSFVAPASGQAIVTASAVGGSSLTDGAMAVYAAPTCSGSLTELACNDDSPLGGLMPMITLSGLVSGTTYYIRFWESGNNAFGTFNICVTRPVTPANDDPCAATVLSVGTTCTNTTSTTGGSTNTAGIPIPTCGNYLGNDVWFRLVAPASGRIAVTTTTVTGSPLTNAAMAIYSASPCSGSMTEIGCNDDLPASNMPALSFTGLTSGASYYLRVWANGNSTFGQFNICAIEPIINDEPCGAVTLTVNTTCIASSYTNALATNSATIADPGCGSFTSSSRDMWFKFVAPASGIAVVESTAGTMTDGSMALYHGSSCAAPSLDLELCSSDEGAGNMPFMRFAELVPGDTYYIRYWGAGSASGTFNLCVRSPAMPATNCAYFLEMYDSNENGWGSSAVQIQINSGPTVSYTVTGFYANALIGLNVGDIVRVTYVNTGSNQNQNTYQIRHIPGGYGVLTQGPSPTNGLVLIKVTDCVPPQPPPEDCRGGVNICGSQTFNGSPSGTGYDVDLRSNSYGCLTSAERQGTWYKFHPSASGTIGLTIAPTNSGDDYDFAIWGPGTTAKCPPNTPPLRCSYSGTTGNTGLRTSSTDFSEGASGDKWVAALDATAGEVYVLYVSNYSQSGLSFNLSWQLTNGASLDCTLLPMDLIEVSAEAMNDEVEVHWSTPSESEVDHYVVERSFDDEHFFPIGTMDATGNTFSRSDYSFPDRQPADGPNYYRVKQVKLNGSPIDSQTRVVIFRKASDQMVIFPNPAGTILFASLLFPEDNTLCWRILDSSGRLVDQDLFAGSVGASLMDIPLDGLNSGSYFLIVNDANDRISANARFVKE